MVPELWGRPLWEKVWPCLDPWESVRLRTAPTHWNVPGKCGPHGELFFFLEKEPVVASNDVLPNPFVSAETLWGKTSKVKRFLEDWEHGRVAWSCHTALDLLCQEMHEAWQLGCCYQEACCHSKECFLSPWTGCESKGEGCGERMMEERT